LHPILESTTEQLILLLTPNSTENSDTHVVSSEWQVNACLPFR